MLAATLRIAATPPPVRYEQSGGRESTPAKKFYKAWQMDDLLASIVDLGTGRDWTVGRDVFKRAACGACHALGLESAGSTWRPISRPWPRNTRATSFCSRFSSRPRR